MDCQIENKTTHIDKTLRMYAVIRNELHMSPGKAASQAGHAFKLLTKNCILHNPKLADEYFSDGGIGTNVCLSSHSLEQMLQAHELCKEANIPSFLVVDEGHVMLPHFDGSPIITALGIGPIDRASVKHITKKFKLYN